MILNILFLLLSIVPGGAMDNPGPYEFSGKISCVDTFHVAELHYIYNRVFDIALKDNRATLYMGGVYYGQDEPDHPDSLLITIDPILSRAAFNLDYIRQLNGMHFEEVRGCQDQYKYIDIINTGKTAFTHFDDAPPLLGNHTLHFTFSPIFEGAEGYYIGVSIFYKVRDTSGYFHTIKGTLIVEFERCKSCQVLFRKFYVPIGYSYSGLHTSEYAIPDRMCD